VSQEIGGKPLKECTSIGLEKNGEVVAGAVYQYHTGDNIFIHVACRGRLTPAFLCAVARYPFMQLGCKRVTATVRQDNAASINVCKKAGFKQEGFLRGTDQIVFGLLKEECRFLEGKWHAALLDGLSKPAG
jgi:RimJ/RimL family protein N-acetyltransferase